MDMRPSPQLVKPGQHRCRLGDLNVGQGAILDVFTFRKFGFGHHHQHDPRRQAMVGQIRRSRCVAPGKVLIVELDIGQIVRFKISNPMARFHFDNGTGFYTHHIAGAIDLDRFVNRCRQWREANAFTLQRQLHRNFRPQR